MDAKMAISTTSGGIWWKSQSWLPGPPRKHQFGVVFPGPNHCFAHGAPKSAKASATRPRAAMSEDSRLVLRLSSSSRIQFRCSMSSPFAQEGPSGGRAAKTPNWYQNAPNWYQNAPNWCQKILQRADLHTCTESR